MKARVKLQGLRNFGARLLALIAFASNGLAAPWVQTTSLPDTYEWHTSVYSSGHLYQAGGLSGAGGFLDSTNVFFAQVYSNGTIGNWTTTTSLPEGVFLHAGAAVNGFFYVIGGNHFTLDNGPGLPTNIVYFSKINSDGSLDSWHITNPLPHNSRSASAAGWSNKLYVIGGSDGSTLQNMVYSANVQSDGSLSSWVEQIPYPYGVYAHAEAVNGALYVFGGAVGDGTATTNAVYYSTIDAEGNLTAWNLTTPLPQPIGEFGVVAAQGWVFTIGGFNGTTPISNVYSALVNGDGSLGSWSETTPLPVPLYYHAVAASDSFIFTTGGIDAVNNSSAVYSTALPAPPPMPTLGVWVVTNGSCQLQLTSATNTGFGLQASTNLVTWANIGWGFTGADGTLLLTDTNADQFPNRFYRAYWPLP